TLTAPADFSRGRPVHRAALPVRSRHRPGGRCLNKIIHLRRIVDRAIDPSSPSRTFPGGSVNTVKSKDGTSIAYEKAGSGPPLILVDGALCSRKFGPMPKLAPLLAGRFTVYWYDRRGRGDSGDQKPYSREREVEDIGALVGVAGGSAALLGLSS